jgi:hypothetical protein
MFENFKARRAALISLYPNSIEITKTTRGYTWNVKIRCEPGQEDEIIERIKQLDIKLKKDFGEGGSI